MTAPAQSTPPLGPELTDDDVLDAMTRIPGYLDITTDDFRDVYRLAYGHAIERLVGGVRAADLMRRDDTAVGPQMTLYRAAELMVERELKSLPVVDGERRVIGMLSESDVLGLLGAANFLELIIESDREHAEHRRRLTQTDVGDVMTSPVVMVAEDAEFASILGAFRRHDGRRMPVVDLAGRLVGMLARKDFIAACPLQVPS
ncbi:MAG: CBS domain-containing protein [Chromatiaceae bacterium]|jgi:CBS-domain-containing membrane protein|nr:CBS domain-containing protein [Chromatiaceae bacterium]